MYIHQAFFDKFKFVIYLLKINFQKINLISIIKSIENYKVHSKLLISNFSKLEQAKRVSVLY